MSRLPGWLDRVGAGLTKVGKRLEERRAEVTRDREPDDDPERHTADPDRMP
ncbi:AI-2E family transporter, partial [Streptomyces sp. McG7]|nr:AI-2E family transporter [Streptomyces sp. McG7]